MSEYLNKIREVLLSFSKPVEPLSKNRIRFEDIHSNKRLGGMSFIYQQLLTYDTNLRDEEIVEAYLKFSDRIQINTFAAAELNWATIATICYYRPHLTSLLIRPGLLNIVYSLGEELDASTVFDFIEHRILGSGVEPYGGLPHDVGITWLREVLPTQKILVQQMLDQVIEQNQQELDEL